MLEVMAHLGADSRIRNAFLVKVSVPITVWRQRKIAGVFQQLAALLLLLFSGRDFAAKQRAGDCMGKVSKQTRPLA